jgi:hypothetical protein
MAVLEIKWKAVYTLVFRIYTASMGGGHVTWVPCHHGMARPQVADGGDGLQIWEVAANILKK